MSPKFLHALHFTLIAEGEYSNDPADSGGETRWGIASATWGKIESFDQAVAIYWDHFWNELHLDCERIEPMEVAMKVFDVAVNFGPVTGAMIVQEALCSIGYGDLKVDGNIGSKTRSAISSAHARYGRGRVVAAISAIQAVKYLASSHDRFRAGWLWRAGRDPGLHLS
jgi:lysozyme family protein